MREEVSDEQYNRVAFYAVGGFFWELRKRFVGEKVSVNFLFSLTKTSLNVFAYFNIG